jgi:hypothetical protein
MADYRYDDCFTELNSEIQTTKAFSDELEELCMELEGVTLYKNLYRALLKKYVFLVSCPFILERLVRTVYREEPFCSHFTSDILREIIDDLQA